MAFKQSYLTEHVETKGYSENWNAWLSDKADYYLHQNISMNIIIWDPNTSEDSVNTSNYAHTATLLHLHYSRDLKNYQLFSLHYANITYGLLGIGKHSQYWTTRRA